MESRRRLARSGPDRFCSSCDGVEPGLRCSVTAAATMDGLALIPALPGLGAVHHITGHAVAGPPGRHAKRPTPRETTVIFAA